MIDDAIVFWSASAGSSFPSSGTWRAGTTVERHNGIVDAQTLLEQLRRSISGRESTMSDDDDVT